MIMLAAGMMGVFASIPMGWNGLLLVGALALGAEALAALTIPSLPAFKRAIDQGNRERARTLRRQSLLSELNRLGDSRAIETYQHMNSLVQVLYKTATEPRASLGAVDIEKLEDLTVDYLNLCAVSLTLKQRKDTAKDQIVAARIASIEAQLKTPSLPEGELRHLRSALNEYTDVLQRSRRLIARRSALDALLISMPDKLEEIYQLVMTAPYSNELGSQLEDSLSRLQIAEEVAVEFDSSDLFDVNTPKRAYREDVPIDRAKPRMVGVKNV